MVLAGIERDVDTNVSEAQVFKIKTTAQAFKILSSNLYSNKIRAIIRELSCNAVDAHVAAKNPNPFEVHLPSTFEPYFSVKDFGIGLSQNDVFNLYNSYFESTKSQSNDFIGALGLGSKSPFSYVDTFTVESIYEGEKKIYSTYLNGAGIPTTSLMTTEPCEDHNGLEIKIPVDEDDFNKFRSEAEIVFYPFTLKPIVKNNSNYLDLSEYEKTNNLVINSGTGWKFYKHFPRGIEDDAYARQGSILYPLNASILKDKLSSDVQEKMDFVFDNRIIIDFPLGSLDIAASREEISYDAPTIKNIQDRINNIYDEITVAFNEEINKLSLYDAMVYFNKTILNAVRGGGNLSLLHKESGITIRANEYLQLEKKIVYYDMEKRYGYGALNDYRINKKENEPCIDRYSGKTSWPLRIMPDSTRFFFVELDEDIAETKLRNKLRYYVGSKASGWATVIPFLPDLKAEIMKAFGNPAYVTLSSIEIPVFVEEKVKKQRKTEENFSSKNYISTATCMDFYTVSEEDDTIKYYIPIYIDNYLMDVGETNAYGLVDGKKVVYDSSIRAYVKALKDYGFFKNGAKYYCVRKKELGYKRMGTDENMKPLDKAAEVFLLDYIDKHQTKLIRHLKKAKELEALKKIEVVANAFKGSKHAKIFVDNLEDNQLKKAYLELSNTKMQNNIQAAFEIFENNCTPVSVKQKIIGLAPTIDETIYDDLKFLNWVDLSAWRDDCPERMKKIAEIVNAYYRDKTLNT